MQRVDSSNASTQVRNDSQCPVSRFSNVISATPAKRITFYKSGDTQFGGVRMAIHKRSFKCFDALLDDLSQKVPLPFGVRTITTPRGTHSIHRLEQLEDGGCYLCSDRRHVKPIDMQAAGKRPLVWHHSHPHNTRKKPSRPEEAPTGHSGQHYHRHPKRIVLVKNNDPAVRRSIILSRRTARSLKAFMEEISELMQYHVRKVYTIEGRKIDSIQSLMQCPNVLVCAGREPFKPLMLENLRKHSEEKLPGMTSRSRSSVCSEGHDSKKNVNFGLETKKSIIHPRSDSSNRSTRFSLSSEKSYPNGLCTTPGQSGCVSTCPYTKDVILNDDIEKRVLVNKDGSLSVEMKVRFRLVNDETLQWSTEIKKSAATLNENGSVKEGDSHYLQGKVEYSDPESNSPCEAEEAGVAKLFQKHLEESHCQNCCNHCQEYDIWKNPIHKNNGSRKSSSSSGSSHKVMHKKASVDSVRTISRSSEEYTKHVVEKASCFQQTVEEGDTRVEYCSIRRCCSRSEVSATGTKLKGKRTMEDTCESTAGGICHHGDRNPNTAEFGISFGNPTHFEVCTAAEDRPISAISNSSNVLQSLKEDKDDDYDDLPPSASRASEWCLNDNAEQDSQVTCFHCHGCQTSTNSYLSPRPPSKVSSSSAFSLKHKNYRYPAPEVPLQQNCTDIDRTDSDRSSKVSSRSHSFYCGATTPASVASDMQNGLGTQFTMPKGCKVSNTYQVRTNSSSRASVSHVHEHKEVREEGTESRNRSISAMSANPNISGNSEKPKVCHCCGGCEKSVTPVLITQDTPAQEVDKEVEVKSLDGRTSNSHSRVASPEEGCFSNGTENNDRVQSEVIHGRSDSALSDLLNPSVTKTSNNSDQTESMISEKAIVERVEEKTKSAMSVKSNASTKTKTKSVMLDGILEKEKGEEFSQDERSVSQVSGYSQSSAKSRSSHKSHCSKSKCRITSRSGNSDNVGNTSAKLATTQHKDSERAVSPVSAASSANHGKDTVDSAVSSKSHSYSKHQYEDEVVDKAVTPSPTTPDVKYDQDQVTAMQERAPSAVSNCSKTSKKSKTSSKGFHIVEENIKCTELNETEMVVAKGSDIECNERVPSAVSAKTHTSNASSRSHKTKSPVTAAASPPTPIADASSERPASVVSKSSRVSVKSNAFSDRAPRLTLKPSDAPPEQGSGQEAGDAKECAPNSLNVSSPSPKRKKRVPAQSTTKSPITTESNDRVPSGLSVNSKASSKSTKSNKSHCQSDLVEPVSASDGCVETMICNLSEKSRTANLPSPSQLSQSGDPLSPTSTASVSLGFGQEEIYDDVSEKPACNTSRIVKECPSERCTPELDNAENSEKVKIRERVNTTTSTSSAVSESSKRSHVTQELSKSREQALSPTLVAKPESKAESKAGSQLSKINDRAASSLSVASDTSRNKSPSRTSQHSENSSTMNRSKCATQTDNACKCCYNAETDNTSVISKPSSKCSQNRLASGKATPTKPAKSQDEGTTKIKKKSSSYLEIKGSEKTSDCNSDAGSVHSLKASKSEKRVHNKEEQTSRQSSVAMSDISQSQAQMPTKHRGILNHLDSSSDSVLSHTLSAADLLREKVDDMRRVSREAGSNASGKNCALEETKNNSSKGEKRCKQRKISTSSQSKSENQGLEMIPSNLPNSTPTEVVNDWLRNIPADCAIYEMEDEFLEQRDGVPQGMTVNEEDISQKDKGQISENVLKCEESQDAVLAEDAGLLKEDECVVCDDTPACNSTSQTNAAAVPSPPPKLTKRASLPKRCHSSVQVMKVLLSPKLDRCNSLPEVSAVYGRKLSTSAKGLLDCLANLQLIDANGDKDDKYNEIISILQSLWVYQPSESEQEVKDQPSAEDDFNPRSSSGVDVSSGSIGSGKGSIGGAVEKSESAQVTTASVGEQDALAEVQQEPEIEGEHDSSNTLQITDTSNVPSDSITPDIAERMRFSPEDEKLNEEQQTEDLQASEEVTESNENQREINEAATTFSPKTDQENDSEALKSATDTEIDPIKNTETSPSAQKGVLTKRVSQDPDPVWVLGLLKKLEKQFMSHYANAMAEFKVKWDLNDNEMLDTMISELKAEVHKRIQCSINRELQKIQSRAGRTPRPPVSMLSRDSTVQTEQRRRRLKVMRNKSIDPSLSRSEDMNTASGTEFSDQRSEDEYCPCDTCMKKKMASKAIQRAEALSLAPVLMDFDLRKILQTKKNPLVTTEIKPEELKNVKQVASCNNFHDNLEVVQEEAEAHNDLNSHTDENKVDDIKDEADEAGDADQTKDENEDVAEKEEPSQGGNEKADEAVEEEGEIAERKSETGQDEAEGGKTEEDERVDEKEEEVENREEATTVDETVKGEVVQPDDTTEDTAKDEETAKTEDVVDEEASQTGETGKEIEETYIQEDTAEERELIKEEENEELVVKEGETGEDEGIAEEVTKEREETALEGELVEERTAEESALDGKAQREELEESDSEIKTSSERSGDDAPAADATEAEANKNEIADTTESEAADDIKSSNDVGDGNQSVSAEQEDMTEAESEQKPSSSRVSEEKEDDHSDVEDPVTDPNPGSMVAESTEEAENHEEDPDHHSQSDNNQDKEDNPSSVEVISDNAEADAPGQSSCEDSECRLMKQITKTSVESQPGSLEDSKDATVKAKLKDIHSFMESSESQEDNIVVIMKQSPFTERRIVSTRPGNKEEVENEVIEWQVSPKRRNRSPARANKQRRLRD